MVDAVIFWRVFMSLGKARATMLIFHVFAAFFIGVSHLHVKTTNVATSICGVWSKRGQVPFVIKKFFLRFVFHWKLIAQFISTS